MIAGRRVQAAQEAWRGDRADEWSAKARTPPKHRRQEREDVRLLRAQGNLSRPSRVRARDLKYFKLLSVL